MSKSLILLIAIFCLWFVIGATDKIADKNKTPDNFADDGVKRVYLPSQQYAAIFLNTTRQNTGTVPFVNEVRL